MRRFQSHQHREMQAKAGQETNAQVQRGENGIVVTATCNDTSGASITCLAANGDAGSGAGNTVTVNVNEPFTFLTPLISGFFGGN